jgi:hypothetical protein
MTSQKNFQDRVNKVVWHIQNINNNMSGIPRSFLCYILDYGFYNTEHQYLLENI